MSTVQNPSHTFQTAGPYTVTVLVTDSGGRTANQTFTVTASNAPVAGAGPGVASWVGYLVLALVIVVAVAVAFMIRRRKLKRVPPDQPGQV